MATAVSETPIEPLLLDDRTTSRDVIPERSERGELLVTSIKNDAVAATFSIEDDAADDEHLHELDSVEAEISHLASNPRLEAQRHLPAVEMAAPLLVEATPDLHEGSSHSYTVQDNEPAEAPAPHQDASATDKIHETESLHPDARSTDKSHEMEPLYQETHTEPQEAHQHEDEAQSLHEPAQPHRSDAQAIALVQEFLYHKITENQCTSHTREIHEYLAANMSDAQLSAVLPGVIQSLATQFHNEAAAQKREVSLDVQSSLCLLEQMFLSLGRRSPLQDMYTEEEEELLNQLGHANSVKNLLKV